LLSGRRWLVVAPTVTAGDSLLDVVPLDASVPADVAVPVRASRRSGPRAARRTRSVVPAADFRRPFRADPSWVPEHARGCPVQASAGARTHTLCRAPSRPRHPLPPPPGLRRAGRRSTAVACGHRQWPHATAGSARPLGV